MSDRNLFYKVRKDIVTAVHAAKAGHPGGSLSAADVFTYLYFEEMNIDPKDPKKADRDRFVLSKGHTAPGLYSVLAERGYFPKEDLKTLRHLGSYLQGHPDMKHIPGVDMSSGSLGQGISAAAGMALICSPCTTAPLSAILLYIAQSGNMWLGGVLPNSVMMTIEYIHCWVMVRSRKARCGRQLCSQASVNWTTWL